MDHLSFVSQSHITGICNSEVVTPLNISQGRDAVFRLDQNIGNDAQGIMWIFLTQQLILANISAGESSPDRINNSKQYNGRLSLLLDKSLRLSNLTTEDSGCYEADIKSSLGGITTQKFILTVLENESTDLTMVLWIMAAILGLLFLIAYFICRKRQGTQRRGELHTEENGRSQMASPQTNEESLRMLDGTIIQQHVTGMWNGLGTQQENSRDQHRQELGDEEGKGTESMDHRRTAQNSNLTTSVKNVGSCQTPFYNVLVVLRRSWNQPWSQRNNHHENIQG
ncbi:uncharacterized protein LOC127559754 [Antechinus flavipes]|uniref:uncharacterized protein LOC127559754 n=1 Tax=Antechinus flavipes TaxID=38775 RepID=UPI00223615F6|nr:uncharacterized protein LOC127559754 [Antechinus flavipes]XP_051849709.1 uncharacterized protein LOC127559754 [Antechinus flavipes]